MWFKHPKYSAARSEFSTEFSSAKLTYLHYSLPKILFICGGDEKNHKNRSIIERYIEVHHAQYLTFRAEYAWAVISKYGDEDGAVNALSLEEWLADFSDMVLILVESFGTVAELGAFSLSPPLRKKLFPILDKKFEKDDSFINTGPVKWVDLDSRYKPSIYTNFTAILTCMPDLEERLARSTTGSIYFERSVYGKYRYTKKVLLFFILYVVSSFGPVTTKEVVGIVNDVISYKDKKVISFVMSIGVALNIFNEHEIDGDIFFTCFDYEKLFRSSETRSLLHEIQRSRARILSRLIMIPEYRRVLDKVVKNAS